MKDIIKFIVNAIYRLAFVGTIVVGMVGAVYEIIGHAKFQALLASIGILNGFEQYWTVSIILLLVLVVTHFAKVALGNS